MFKKLLYFICTIGLILASCSSSNDDGIFASDTTTPSNSNGNSSNDQPGKITAGEWNDLNNWTFWLNLMNSDFGNYTNHWQFHNNNRVTVIIKDQQDNLINNAIVKLNRNGITHFITKTDNHGKAELWIDLFQFNNNVDYTSITLDVENGTKIVKDVKPFSQGINYVEIPTKIIDNKIEISFVVDATGSMSDELEFLKTELYDVISRIKTANPESIIYTSSVFYRDEGDEYVTRISHFTSDIKNTINFIKDQSANGGGDFPEAVHTALDKAINELQWSENAKTRILFLLLDAPPHHNQNVISDIQKNILKSTEKGIKIIPISASGIDKETEFLLRFLSITTNGTYVFITNDSGIGNDHIQASVGEYQIELLNNLMVRLINKYAQ